MNANPNEKQGRPAKIKTREARRDIKQLDRAAIAGHRMKRVTLKTKARAASVAAATSTAVADSVKTAFIGSAKEVAESSASASANEVPESFAADKITEQSKSAAEQAAQAFSHPRKKAAKNVRGAKQDFQKAQAQSRRAKRQFSELKKLFKGEQAGTDGAAKPSKRKAKSGAKGIKGQSGAAKKSAKNIKNAKNAPKTAQAAARSTARNARNAAKSAQKSRQLVKQIRQNARRAVQITRQTVKATVAAIKAAVAATKALATAIAAGGWVAVVIILVLVMAGLLLSSGFGIFLSGEKSGGKTVTDVIAELNQEFYRKMDMLEYNNVHDILEFRGAMAVRWDEVLAVYAVKVNTDLESPAEVATLDDQKIGKLRDVLNDMVSLSHSLQTMVQERTSTDKDGNEITETVTITTLTITLTITLTQKSADEMAAQYGFSEKQKEQLHELLSPEYDSLLAALLGG